MAITYDVTAESGQTVYGQKDSSNRDMRSYLVKGGGTLDVQCKAWKPNKTITIEPGGRLVKDGSFETWTHIQTTVTIGTDGSETRSELRQSSSAYPWSISTLYNGKLYAYSTDIWLGDMGAVGTVTLKDCTVKLDGILATGLNSFYKQTFTNTTVTVKGHAIRKDASYFSAEGTILGLTLDNSTITVDDGAADTVAEKVVFKTTAMKNNSSVAVESGTYVEISSGSTVTMDATSSLTVGTLTNKGKLSLVAGDADAASVNLTGYAGTGAITVDMKDATEALYLLIDSTAAAMTLADYGTLTFTNNTNGYHGLVINNDLYAANIDPDMSVIAVNAAWTDKAVGEAIAIGDKTYYFGVNAFEQMADFIPSLEGGKIIAYGNGKVAATETTSGEGIEINNPGTYSISGTEWSDLGYLQLNSEKAVLDERIVVNIDDSNLVVNKVQARRDADYNITNSHLDFNNNTPSRGYTCIYANSTLNLTNSVYGYNAYVGNSADIVAGRAGIDATKIDPMDNKAKSAMQVCGKLIADNSTLLTVTGDDTIGFGVMDKGYVELKDSVLYAGAIAIGLAQSDTKKKSQDTGVDVATMVLDNSVLIRQHADNFKLDIGYSSGVNGKLIVKNDSLIDRADAPMNIAAGSELEISDSTVLIKSITNAGTISITDDATITVTNTLTNSGAIAISNGAMLTFNGALNNTGTITVDMTGLEKIEYKLVDYIGSDAATDMVYGTFSANNDYTLSVVDGDLIATKQIDLSNIYVDDDWEGAAEGTEVADGKVFGLNAFSNLQDAANAVEDGGTVNIMAGTYDDKLVLDKFDNSVATGITAVKSIAFIGETDTETGANLVKVTGGIRIGATGSSNASNLFWNKATSFTNMDIEVATDACQLWIANSENLTFTNVKMLATAGEMSLTPLEIKNGSYLGTTIFNNCTIQNGYADLYNCNDDKMLFFNDCQFLNAKVNITNNCPAEFNGCAFNTVITDGYGNMYLIRTYGKEVIVNDSSFSITTADGTVAAPADGETWAYVWTRTKDGNVPNQQAILTNCTFNKQDNLFTNGAVTIFNNLETNNEPIVLVNPTFNGSVDDFITDLTTAANANNTFGEIIVQGYTEVIDGVSTTYEDTRLWNDDHWVGEDGSNIYVNAAWTDKAFGEQVGEGMYFGLNAFNNMSDAAKKAIGKDDASIQVLGDAAIVSGGNFVNTNATITGNAIFKWQPWMFIGRGGAAGTTQDATVTFDGATIARAASAGDQSIHVSGQEGDGSSKGNGILNITNASDITADWIIDKNIVNIDKGSKLSVTNKLVVAGRPASETADGEDATAVLNVDASTVSNGSSTFGVTLGNEGNGIVNLTNGAVFDAASLDNQAKGTINVTDSTLTAGSLTNAGAVNVFGESTLGGAITGNAVTFDGTTTAATVTLNTVTAEKAVAKGDVTLAGNGSFTSALYTSLDENGEYKNTGDRTGGADLTIGEDANVYAYALYGANGATVDVEDGATLKVGYLNNYASATTNVKEGAYLNAKEGEAHINAMGNLNVAGSADAVDLQIYNAKDATYNQAGRVTVTGTMAADRTVVGAANTEDKKAAVAGEGDATTATLDINGGSFSVSHFGDYQSFEVKEGGEVLVRNGGSLSVTCDLSNAGNITIDIQSMMTVTGAATNAGTITIDATGYTSGLYKLADFNGVSGSGSVAIDSATVADGVTVSVKVMNDGDIYIGSFDASILYVNAAWTDKAFGEQVGEGMYFGLNAFTSAKEAAESVTSSTEKIIALSDVTETGISVPVLKVSRDLSIEAENPQTIDWKVSSNSALAPDTDGKVYILGDGTMTQTVTIGENVTLKANNGEGGSYGSALYIGYSSDQALNLDVNGNVETHQFYIGANSNVTIGSTGTLKTTSENLIVRRYATLTANGDGNFTDAAPQLDLSYASIQGGTVTLNDTAADMGAWLEIWNRNGLSDDTPTVNVNNSTLTAGKLNMWSNAAVKTAALNATNSTLAFDTTGSVNADGTVTLNASTATFGGALDNAGAINVNASTLSAASLANTGAFNVMGESTLNIAAATGNAISLQDGATLTDSNVAAVVNTFGTASIADSTLNNTLNVGYNGYADAAVTLNLAGGVNQARGNTYLGQDGDVNVSDTLNVTGDDNVLGSIYARHTSVINVSDGSLGVKDYLLSYGAINVTNGSLTVLPHEAQDLNYGVSELVVDGRPNKKANGLAKMTLDGSTVTAGILSVGQTTGGHIGTEDDDSGSGEVLLKNGSTLTLTGNNASALFLQERFSGMEAVSLKAQDASTINATGTVEIGAGAELAINASTMNATSTFTNAGTIQLDGAAVLTAANGIANNGKVTIGSADTAFTGALNAAITGTGHVQVKNAEMTIGTDNSINVTTVSVGRMTESEIGGSTPGAKVTVNEGAVFRGSGELWVGSENDNRQTAETHDHSYILEVNGGNVHGGNQFTIRNDGYLYAYNGATVTGGAAPIRGDVLLSGTNTLMSFSNSANIYGEATGAGENNGVSTVLVQNGASFVVNGPASIGKDGVETRQGNLVLDNGSATVNSLTLYTSGIVTLKNGGVLTVNGALTNGGAINVAGNASITVNSMVSTGSVNLASGALLTFDGALTNSGTITVDMAGLTGFEYKVIDFVNDNADATTLGTLEATNDYKLEVRDGDLFAVKDVNADLVYVNTAWSSKTAGDLVYTDEEPNGYFGKNAFAAITDATALTPEKMVVLGGSYSSKTQYMNGVDTTIENGSFGVSHGGQLMKIAAHQWLDVEGDTNYTIENGTFGVLSGADRISTADSSRTKVGGCSRYGNSNLTIKGGVFNGEVMGGMFVTASTLAGDSAALEGNVYMTISGGTFAKNIIGGNGAANTDISNRADLTGNVNLTINVSEGNAVKINGNVIAGSYGIGFVNGDLNVTITGLGDNLIFTGKLIGANGGATYKTDSSTKIRSFTTTVDGSRNLTFDAFTGDFKANAMAFQNVSFTGDSEVNFTNTALNMADATNWNFEFGSSANGIAINNFKGDTLNFDLTDWDEGTESWDVLSGKAASFTGWDDASTVVKFNNVVATYSEGCWTGNGYTLTLADEGSNKKFVITSLNA